MNYFGDFKSFDGKDYRVYIEPDSGNTYHEIALAGYSPFTVTYSESDTLYDAIRTSTAQISIVNDEYLFDAFKEIATGTKVRLVEKFSGNENNIWLGYLQNNLQNASYENCIETINLQASDCLAKAQYMEYKPLGETKNLVNFKDIIASFIARTGYEFNVLVPTTRVHGTEPIMLEKIGISEFNFYTSDTDKAWSYQEVLEEFSKYFGFTLIQWHGDLIFLDLESYSRRNSAVYRHYIYDDGELYYYMSVSRGDAKELNAEDYTKGGGQVTFQTIYNRIRVNCNYYDVDTVIPDIFNDDYISYVYGAKSEVRQIHEPLGRPKYNTNDYKQNFESEDSNNHYRRELLNRNYKEHWYHTYNESALTQNEIDNYTDFYVTAFDEEASSMSAIRNGWRWQCYWGKNVYGSTWAPESDTNQFDDYDATNHTEIGSYQDWQNGDNSKSFTALFNGRYAYQGTWYADFMLYYNGMQFAAVNDNYWHPFYAQEGDLNPVFWYCINPFYGCVGFIPYDTDWRATTTYPMYSNVAPDYMPQIYYDQVLPVSNEVVTLAWVSFKIDNSRCERDRQFTAIFEYSNNPIYSGTTVFTVPAHQSVENSITLSTYVEGGSDMWSLQIISEDGTSGGTSWTRLEGLSIIYPADRSLEKDCVGARIVELADNPKQEEQPTNSLSFTRYLMLACQGSPSGETAGQTDLSLHLPLYELETTLAPAVYVAPNTFFFINCSAIFERYWSLDYINSEWAQDKSKIYNKNGGIYNQAPALVFCFGVGGKYWNGRQWQDSECNFKVDLYNDDSEGNTAWNKSMPIKNQVGWQQWSSGEGYTIPINETINLNGKIVFKICTPVKMQTPGRGEYKQNFNGYCWLTGLSVGLAKKGDEKSSNVDIIYENVISEDSVNELSEISLKINTYPKLGRMGYSFLAYDGYLIDTIRDNSLDGEEHVPEEAIVGRYVTQYQTPTRKEIITLGMDVDPFTMIHDSYWASDFVVIGQTLDYQMAQNQLNLEEIKKNTSTLDGTVIVYRGSGSTEPDWWQATGWGANVIGHGRTAGGGYITFDAPPTNIPAGTFTSEYQMSRLELPYSINTVNDAIKGQSAITIVCSAVTAPILMSEGALSGNTGILVTPDGSNYDTWYERLGWTKPTGTIQATVTAKTVAGVASVVSFPFEYSGTQPLSVTPQSAYSWAQGSVKYSTVEIKVSANNTVSGRTAVFTLSDGTSTQNFSVTQASVIITLRVDKSKVIVSSDGEYTKPQITVKYNGDVTNLSVSSNQSWLTPSVPVDWELATDGSGAQQGTITYDCGANTSSGGTSRSATITITDGTLSQTIDVKQNAPMVMTNLKVYYGDDYNGWLEAPSYNGAQLDYLLPQSGYANVMVRYEIKYSTGITIPFTLYMSYADGYEEGYFYEKVPLGFAMKNTFPSLTKWLFRNDNQFLYTSRYNADTGTYPSNNGRRETFLISDFFNGVRTRNNTVFGDGYKVNAFNFTSEGGGYLIKDNGSEATIRIYQKA